MAFRRAELFRKIHTFVRAAAVCNVFNFIRHETLRIANNMME